MQRRRYLHPILTCEAAKEREAAILKDAESEWSAMLRAGRGVGAGIERDYRELRPWPAKPRLLVLAGKGNNAGDAFIACDFLLSLFPRASLTVLLTAEPDQLKPLAARAFERVSGRCAVHVIEASTGVPAITELLESAAGAEEFDVCVDGLLGMAFRPPVRQPTRAILEAVNGYGAIALRAAVDVPSGKGDASDEVCFHADFSYATGIAKRVLFEGLAESGRVRFVDLGFFDAPEAPEPDTAHTEALLTGAILDPLRALRPASVDKRAFGHLFVVGGSAYMPGALLMSVLAAVRSGVGLVTAFAPASVAATLSAQVPEAMWVPWPETENGTLSPRAMPLLYERLEQATAVLAGPGLGKDRYTERIAQDMVKHVEAPLVLDADALRQRVVELAPKRKAGLGTVTVTPHMGEFMRIAKLPEPDYAVGPLMRFSSQYRLLTVLKSSLTRICDGESVLYTTYGGPVLSRGGSGDLLSGLIGGMVAQERTEVRTAVGQGLVLHGLAAQALARSEGQVAVHTSRLLEHLGEVLRTYESG